MSNFNYTSSNGLRVGNCAICTYQCVLNYKFNIGDLAYNKNKANKGKLEKIYIKKIILSSFCNYRCKDFSPIYVSMLNSFYNEKDLISLEEATVIVKQYQDYINALKEQLALDCK